MSSVFIYANIFYNILFKLLKGDSFAAYGMGC